MLVHPSVRGLWSMFISLALLSGLTLSTRGQDELPPEIDSDGVQTLTRGPVHEAFASPTVADPEPGLIVPKKPPEDIREQPPEYQPEGQNVQWFPGYWAWDEDREDFIWISGAWRDPPPGKRWVPGYWAEVPGGFQWVAGFWIDEVAEEMNYLKPPPQSLEQGPSVASPGDDYFYVPGTWTYVNNDYAWQAGYYAPYREDWVYVPAHWIWTPRGCIFVNGYWDWRVPRRGQIFAPVFFTPVVYQQPTFYYTPRCTINTSNLFVHLWIRPNYCHYYFGNYYGPTYAHRHFTPWCNYQSRPRCYDPLLTYCNVHYHRQGINYASRMQGWHNHYDRTLQDRPPVTYRDQIAHQRDRSDNRPGSQPHRTLMAEDLKDVIHKPDHGSSWKKLDVAAKERNKSTMDEVKQLHNLRLDQEKVSFVNTSGRRPGAGLDKQLTDQPDLKLPGNNRPGRPDRTPDGDRPKAGFDPGKVGDVVGDHAKPGKVKIPRSTLATTKPTTDKPAFKVPEMPEKSIVNRPTLTRPGANDSGDRPGRSLNVPELGDKPTKVPGLRNPGTNPADTAGNNDGPTRSIKRPEVGTKVPALTGPDLSVGGNDGPKKSSPGGSSAAAAAQQRLEALKRQQQNTLNNLRDPGRSIGGNTGNNVGGNPGVIRPNTPRVETPRFETPKIEKPKTSFGGSNQPRNDVPRNLTPSVAPRNFTPSVEPRVSKPTIDRSPAPRTEVQRPSAVVPRINTAPRNQGNGGNGNKEGEKKRGR
jgi:hypothetical protein